MYNFDLRPLIWLGAAVASIIIGSIWFVTWLASDDSIRTDKPIKPELELIIKDNKVDTVYVYRQP